MKHMKKILLMLSILFFVAINTVYSYTLIVETDPEISGVQVAVCEYPCGGDWIIKHTDYYGKAYFTVNEGKYMIWIEDVHGEYKFKKWSTEYGLEINCMEEQNPVYVEIKGDAKIRAIYEIEESFINYLVKIKVSDDGLYSFAPKFELYYKDSLIYSGSIWSGSSYNAYLQPNLEYTLKIQNIYTISEKYKCKVDSVSSKDVTIISKSVEDNYYVVKFKPNKQYSELYIFYHCSSQISPPTEKPSLSIFTSPVSNVPVKVIYPDGSSKNVTTPTTLTNLEKGYYIIIFPINYYNTEYYTLTSISTKDVNVIFKNISNGTIKIYLNNSGELTGWYLKSVPKIKVILDSIPYSSTICLKNLDTGVELCRKTPSEVYIDSGWYKIYIKNIPNGSNFERFVINGYDYYSSTLIYYISTNTNIIAKLKPITVSLSIISIPIPVKITLKNEQGEKIIEGYTPLNLDILPGNYTIEYPTSIENYTFDKIECSGVICSGNKIQVKSSGSVQLWYKEVVSPPPSQEKYIVEIKTPYNLDVTKIYSKDNKLLMTLYGPSKIELTKGEYYFETESILIDPFVKFIFKFWKIDENFYKDTKILVNVNKNITITKIFDVYYSVIVYVKKETQFLSNFPVKINGTTYYTNESGIVKTWILKNSKILIEVPKFIENKTYYTEPNVIEYVVNRPIETTFVYFKTNKSINITPSEKAYWLYIYVKDEYGNSIDGINILIYNQTNDLVFKGVSIDGKIFVKLSPNKYAILALFHQGQWLISNIIGADKCTGSNYCYVNLSENRTIVVYYVNTSINLNLLQLIVKDINGKRVSGIVEICPLSISGKCYYFELKDGNLTTLLETGKYNIKVIADGYKTKEVPINLECSLIKYITLEPIEYVFKNETIKNKTNISTQHNTTSDLFIKTHNKMYNLTIYTYPDSLIYIYKDDTLIRILSANEKGLAIVQLEPDEYTIKVGDIKRKILLTSDTGILVKNLTKNTPTFTKEVKKTNITNYNLTVCVYYSNSTPVSYGIIEIEHNNTAKNYSLDDKGCRTIIVPKGKYRIRYKDVQKEILVNNDMLVKIKLEKEEGQSWIIYIIIGILGFLIVLVLLVRHYLGSGFI